MDRKIFLIVMAAGRGVRMGTDVPKQFLELDGKAILQRTIEKFVFALPGLKVITVLPNEYIPYWKEYCTKRNFNYPQFLVAGGITRFHSVKNALAKVPDGSIVAIQDAVRPFISTALIQTMISRMQQRTALIPVVPATDTIKVLDSEEYEDGSTVLHTAAGEDVDRSRIWCAQTPQIFLSEEIKSAYSQAFDMAFTDDASVARKKEIPLSYIEGERLNFKITTPEDLALARAILTDSTLSSFVK